MTPQAKLRIRSLLESHRTSSEERIRLCATREGDLALILGTMRTGDAVLDHAGETVLVLTEYLDRLLENKLLDYRNGHIVLIDS
jgi:hypothetical protein